MPDTPDAILTRYEQAVRDRDVDAIVADYAPGAIAYDLAPPLVHQGAGMLDPDGIRTWLESWEEDLVFTHRDLHVIEAGDLAVIHALQNMTGTKKGAGRTSMWFRATIAARRIDEAWKIVHIHTSVPFAMDGSGKALLDLTPED